jgi:hypothetical protein
MNIINAHKRRLLRGMLLKWDEKAGYHDRDGVRPALGPYYVIGMAQGLQRWKNQTVVEEKLDEPLPDLDELNAAIPRSEWEPGLDGQPREPWQLVCAIYLFSPNSGEFFTLLNSTTGMRMCWENFKERWDVMKALRGADVLALVELSTRPFKTRKWGFKPRPDLIVLDWHIAEGRASDRFHCIKPACGPMPRVPIRASGASASPATTVRCSRGPRTNPCRIYLQPSLPIQPTGRS